jgi:hypothetical protein
MPDLHLPIKLLVPVHIPTTALSIQSPISLQVFKNIYREGTT